MLRAILITLTILASTACSTAPPKQDNKTTSASKARTQAGKASYYGKKFHGRKTASGDIYHQGKLTAAHKTLPFNTRVEVTNVNNGKRVVVKINDRGPFVKGRIIDLSSAAFKKIANLNAGVVDVTVKVLN